MGRRRGFTLIELLIVLFIILLISVVALPVVWPAMNRSQVSEGSRLLQGFLAGARDKAIHDGAPSGIRLLPDPQFPLSWTANGQLDATKALAYNRVVPIEPAPSYSEGMVNIYPSLNYSAITNGVPCLVVEQAVLDPNGAPNSPTSWFWNIRIGDQIQIGNAGPWYTVVGPANVGAVAGNSELFVNWGAPQLPLPILPSGNIAEFLFLANGRDDNGNGFIDEGWDAIDNDGDLLVDEVRCPLSPVGEWEPESWIGSLADTGAVNVPYTVRRRPFPSPGAREVSLPTSIVIDASAARSQLPINPYTGAVEIMVRPDGTAFASSAYAVPTSFGLGSAFFHFGLVGREDVGTGTAPTGPWAILTLSARTGRTVVTENPPAVNPFAYVIKQ